MYDELERKFLHIKSRIRRNREEIWEAIVELLEKAGWRCPFGSDKLYEDGGVGMVIVASQVVTTLTLDVVIVLLRRHRSLLGWGRRRNSVGRRD
ncbi:hypothetical protein ACLOJK_024261 [Asimina triloba]